MILDDKFVADFNENVTGRGMYHFYDKIQEYIPLLAEIVNRYSSRIKGTPSVVSMSSQDMIDLVIAFFEDFNPNLCDRLVETLQKAKLIILSDKNKQDGIPTCVALKQGMLEVLLDRCNNINNLCSTAHELAHVSSQQNVEKKLRKDNLLMEIESQFIEKVFAEWLVENGLASQEDYKYKSDFQLQELVVDCKILLNENYVLKQLNHNYSKENLQRIINETPYLEKTIVEMAYGRNGNKNFWGKFILRYIIGELVAQVLYQDYQSMPVATSMIFDEYMSKNSELGLEEGITFLIGENYKERINNTFFSKNEHNN